MGRARVGRDARRVTLCVSLTKHCMRRVASSERALVGTLAIR
ncbi:hypothetical protein BURMUCF1_1449 [Burkholderia multivorans ATCC BAA-247]|nr:hypothetical protein BURMUCF1_1449 [Burkholderia multivorans ATCC BAA-247]